MSIAFAALATYLISYALSGPRPVVGAASPDGYTRVPGVIHVHTTFSDGGGTPDEVVAAAKATGARFVVITDHNNADAKAFEGYHDGVLVIVGSELSTTAGHILGLGISSPTYRFSGDALDGLDDIRELGGAVVVAHPLSAREDLRFTGWDLPGPWGLELINGDSEWRSAGVRVLSSALLYRVNQRRALLGLLNSADPALARWDDLLTKRDVVGIAGADAHSRVPVSKNFAPRFPSYESLFALMRNYVLLKAPLTGSFVDDRDRLLAALKRGNLYVGLDAFAPADAFSFVASAPGISATMGDTLAPSSDLKLRASGRFPKEATIQILQDGHPVATSDSALEVSGSSSGVYRAQVRIAGEPVPWILSNPIYVFGEPAQKERAARAAWPAPQTAPASATVIESFETESHFQPGFDPASSLQQTIDAKAGHDGGKALHLDFKLGPETPSHPNVFVATVDWTHRDLSGKSGLTFWIKADGVYRFTVQVRDANPASRDEGTEWWFASVRTTVEWRQVTIPFTRLRSVNPMTDGKLDLDKVRALVLVIDRGAMKPGSTGNIWLDDFGVY